MGSGNNFALRQEWFERVGGCDERLGPGTPGQGALDIDLFYRVLRAGGRALYDPDAIVHHEPATRSGRLERRRPYGFGMGAACGLRLREGDLYAIRLLPGWLGLRAEGARRAPCSPPLGRARARRRSCSAATAAGIVHGSAQRASGRGPR